MTQKPDMDRDRVIEVVLDMKEAVGLRNKEMAIVTGSAKSIRRKIRVPCRNLKLQLS